jgi:hypothetical protein
MKTAFNTFEQFHGRKNIGGTRLRARWPILKWQEAGPDIGTAELFKFGERYDAVIYQKVYNFDHAEHFDGIKILDLCDPDFLEPGYPIKRMIEAVDAVTCCTDKLAEVLTDMAGNKPVWVIPDCVLDPEKLPMKHHRGSLKYVSWYGYHDNFPALNSAIPALVKRKLELIVVATGPYEPQANFDSLKVRNLPWGPDSWISDFMKADVVINPHLTTGRFAFKSDNKTTQAWAVGMPVALTDADFERFATAEERQKEGDEKRKWVIENRDVRHQVELLKQLILEIKK